MLLCTKSMSSTTKVRRQTTNLSRNGYQTVQHEHTLGVLLRRIIVLWSIHVLRRKLLVVTFLGVRRHLLPARRLGDFHLLAPTRTRFRLGGLDLVHLK